MTLEERLSDGVLPLIADGAIGTRLLDDRATPATGSGQLPCVEQLNLIAPELVKSVHRSYLLAGAELLVTNSFGATESRLQNHDLSPEVVSINKQAAEIACLARSEHTGAEVFVLGSCGPIGTTKDATDQYTVQMAGLVAGGIDAFLLESVRSLVELGAALKAVVTTNHRTYSCLPAIVSICPVDDALGFTDGVLSDLFPLIAESPVLALGVNCGDGGILVERALAELRANYDGPLLAMPSAGLPTLQEGRLRYPLSAHAWADMVSGWHESFGLAVAGGCCGTTPQFIRELRHRLFPKPTVSER